MSSQDPLDILQLMVNDVLVQTGKALRASRKDGQGNVAQAHGSLQSKLPDTICTFHSALDDLENEIIRAKSVVLRDLTQIQERKQQQLKQQQQQQPSQPPQQPQPVEPQSKEPMVIDLDSSPPPANPPIIETKATKPVAPFPDMGMGLPDMDQTNVIIKEEAPPVMPPVTGPEAGTQFKPGPTASTAPMAPMPDMDDKPVDINMDISGDDFTGQDLNFTDMKFSLAPANDDAQIPSTSQEPSFDLATFAPPENGDDLLSLENLLPPNSNDQTNNVSVTQPHASENIARMDHVESLPDATNPESLLSDLTAPKKDDVGDPTFEDILMDTGTDFGAGGGLGEDTFNDLIADRDDTTFDLMEHGEFDASYFGLDNTDET